MKSIRRQQQAADKAARKALRRRNPASVGYGRKVAERKAEQIAALNAGQPHFR